MGILDFLKDKKSKIFQIEESEDNKIRKALLSRSYNRAYLFFGECDRTIEIKGQTITYTHNECFIADNKDPASITRFIRLTGNNLTGNPINVKNYESWTIGGHNDRIFNIEENDVEYRIGSQCLDRSWLDNHYMTGYKIVKETNNRNKTLINKTLKNIAEQEEVTSMFEK